MFSFNTRSYCIYYFIRFSSLYEFIQDDDLFAKLDIPGGVCTDVTLNMDINVFEKRVHSPTNQIALDQSDWPSSVA